MVEAGLFKVVDGALGLHPVVEDADKKGACRGRHASSFRHSPAISGVKPVARRVRYPGAKPVP